MRRLPAFLMVVALVAALAPSAALAARPVPTAEWSACTGPTWFYITVAWDNVRPVDIQVVAGDDPGLADEAAADFAFPGHSKSPFTFGVLAAGYAEHAYMNVYVRSNKMVRTGGSIKSISSLPTCAS